MTDPNENRTAFAFDELGLVTKTAVMGKNGANEGDDLDHPTAMFDYHLDCYTDNQTPVYVRTETRETHYHPDEPDPDNAPRRIAYLYSDGLGREIQTKIQAEPGDVPGVTGTVDPRWVGSGWTIYNNKGLPVRKYEPFFSDTSDFEFAREEGVSPIVFYDPLGRAVGTLHPDHTYEKVVFDPWKQRAYDRNDTVMMAPTTDEDVGNFFARLDEGAYSPSWHDTYSGGTSAQQDAAEKAEAHADTPSTTWFDALGRAFLSAADDGTDLLFTRTVLDIEGNALRVIDARGVVVMTTAYDVAGRPMMTSSPDAGDRVMFADVSGKPLLTWDSRDQRFRIAYDEVRRPVGTWLSVDEGAEKLIQQTIFGDSDHADAPANPAILNHRGRVYIQRDGSGETMFDEYDFKGNLLSEMRALAQDFKNVLDWSETVTLEAESFETETEYDALNRVISHTTPDDSETLPTYNEAGLLESVDVKLRGASSATAFVTNIDYNARGQRIKIEYGNGTTTEYEYDPATFRLVHMTTTRTSDSKVLQDLAYTYDPSGNITKIADAVQKTTYFDNTVVDPEKDFTYDAIYRLIQATGREHPGQQPNDVEYPRANDIPHPNDPALRGYTEYYAYDAVGNILEMCHANGSDVWKRRYQIAEDSNRLLATSLPGDNDETYSATYSHDAHGNMTAMPHLGVMAWDPLDRLAKTSVASTGQPVTYYAYDASGQRTRKVTENENGVRTKERLYLGGFEIYREYVAGDLELEREAIHVLDDKQRIALVETQTWDEGEEVEEPEPLLRFQLADHLGSATVETDDAGTIVTYEEYFPFGGTSFHSATTAIPKRYRYTGKERDEETGLYYYGARYYAPWLARWTAADPSGLEDGPNRYAYVGNNPIRMIDPSGTEGTDIGLGLKAQQYEQKQNEQPQQQPQMENSLISPGIELVGPGVAWQTLRKADQAIADPTTSTADTAVLVGLRTLAAPLVYAEEYIGRTAINLPTAMYNEAKWTGEYAASASIRAQGGDKWGAAADAAESASHAANFFLMVGSIAANTVNARAVAGKANAGVAEPTAVPKINDVGRGGSTQLPVQVNKASGDAWSQKVGEELLGSYDVAVPEITVRTQSGVRTRLDWIAKDASGKLELVEAKASETARLTAKQAVAHPEIEQSGAVVVGKGKIDIPGGTIIPPTKVKVKRP